MKKEPSKSTHNSKKTTRRRRKYDEEFKQQALAMVRNGRSPRSVAEALGYWTGASSNASEAKSLSVGATEREKATAVPPLFAAFAKTPIAECVTDHDR